MADASTIAPFVVIGLCCGAALLLVYLLAVRERRRDYRQILADGVKRPGTILSIGRADRAGRCRVVIEFEPGESGRRIHVTQRTRAETLRRLGLMAGSSASVHFLASSPRAAFVPAWVLADQGAAGGAPDHARPAWYFISFTEPGGSAAMTRSFANAFRWTGQGLASVSERAVRFVTTRARPFRSRAAVDRAFPLTDVVNVEVFGNAVSLEVIESGAGHKAIKFWAVDARHAADIAARLPATKTGSFAPVMAEADAFLSRLRALAPYTPVTTALVAINVAVFLAAALLGAGVLTPNPAELVRLGSDFTPLTVGGQWWRLFTSTFLHFGLLHLGFNMWALWVNGPLAERLFGSTRYLLIYLAAGLAGSAASLWWHPLVNGAGASGAIFGVFGALLAFFLRRPGGIPASVVRRHRNSVAIFIAYALANGARIQGIDNAAHIGGLAGGFVLGLVLTRSLDHEREAPAHDYRWAITVAAVVCLALWLDVARSPSTPTLLAKLPAALQPGEPPLTRPQSPESESADGTARRTAPAPAYTPAELTACRAHCTTLFAAAAMECLHQCDIHEPDRYALLLRPQPAPPGREALERPPPRLQTFWGIRLGETRAEVIRGKGPPVRVEQDASLYATAGPGHDGLIEVFYRKTAVAERDPVAAIYYRGDRASAPPELPYIIGISGEQLTDAYRLPVWTTVPDQDSEFEMFSTGLTAYLWHREVLRYGIQEYYRDPQ